MNKLKHKPLILLILDGWGYSKNTDGNAVFSAKTPNFDHLWKNYPHALLSGSGLDVGLPKGQMGNSEVGHLHIGAGRFVLQELTKIDKEIESGEFFKNKVLNKTIDDTLEAKGALHIFGLLSPGGVHSKNTHLEAMATLAAKKGMQNIYIHAFLDGRDTPPKSALNSIQSMEETLNKLGCGQIASITGRYYAMDRDKRWERVEMAYDLITSTKATLQATNAATALSMAYDRGETDEFVKPTCICKQNSNKTKVNDNDAIVFMNFRADRARELSYAFTDPNFKGFSRKIFPKLTAYTTLTEYADDIKAQVAYPIENLKNVLGEVISNAGLRQLRLAETEKYAHVTYFINGGKEQPFKNEDRILIPSPKVATYDLQPEMNASIVTTKLLNAIRSQKYDVIICNYANPDMVGHTGNFKATVKALETIDNYLGQITETLQNTSGEMLIIADHGNAEQMLDPLNKEIFTAHTNNLVPFIYIGRPSKILKFKGTLIDVAPTLLYLMDLKIPKEMTGDLLLRIEGN